MSEFKGFLFSMLLFVAFFLPFLLSMGIQSIQQNAFLKVTTEVQQMVEYEGGITERIKNVADNLNKKGFTLSFYDEKGNKVSGKQPVGRTVEIRYKYKYNGVYGEQIFDTSNYVTILKR